MGRGNTCILLVGTIVTFLGCPTGADSAQSPGPEPTAEPEPTVEPCDGHDGGDGTCLPAGDCVSDFTVLPSGRCAGWENIGALDQPRVTATVTAVSGGAVIAAGRSLDVFDAVVALGDLYAFDAGDSSLRTMNASVTPRKFSDAVAISDTEVLVLGGYDDLNNLMTSVEVIDVVNDTVTAKAPTTLGHSTVALYKVSDDAVVALAGYSTGDYDEQYSISGDSWSAIGIQKAGRLTAGRLQLSTGEVVLLGGLDGANGEELDATDVFDGATSMWSVGEPLTEARHAMGVAVSESDGVFAVGGNTGVGDEFAQSAVVEYSADPRTESFARLEALPGVVGRSGLAVGYLGQDEFVVVGSARVENNFSSAYDASAGDCWVYNAATGERVEVPGLGPRFAVGESAAEIEGVGFLIAGGRDENHDLVDDVDLLRVGAD